VDVPRTERAKMDFCTEIYAVILCGGCSTRIINPHLDKALYNNAYTNLIQEVIKAGIASERILLSIRKDQKEILHSIQSNSSISSKQIVYDNENYSNIGPAGGLIATSLQYTNRIKNLLVLACDLPLIDSKGIRELIDSHFTSSDRLPILTCFTYDTDNNPEPLLSIWTNLALRELKSNIDNAKKTGPCFTIKRLSQIYENKPISQDFLNLLPPKLHKPSNPNWLFNANTHEDWVEASKLQLTADTSSQNVQKQKKSSSYDSSRARISETAPNLFNTTIPIL
jgi:molybdopterin-guanine dinucleotide biosynthesis protein A